MRFLIRWLGTAVAVAVAIWIVPGIKVDYTGNMWWTLLVVAAVLGFISATLGAVLKFISFPLIVLSLGIFNLLINTALLSFSAWLANSLFGTGLIITSFWSCLFGALVISIVSMLMWAILPDGKKDDNSGVKVGVFRL